jgi:hypothetical protein
MTSADDQVVGMKVGMTGDPTRLRGRNLEQVSTMQQPRKVERSCPLFVPTDVGKEQDEMKMNG